MLHSRLFPSSASQKRAQPFFSFLRANAAAAPIAIAYAARVVFNGDSISRAAFRRQPYVRYKVRQASSPIQSNGHAVLSPCLETDKSEFLSGDKNLVHRS